MNIEKSIFSYDIDRFNFIIIVIIIIIIIIIIIRAVDEREYLVILGIFFLYSS